MTIPNPVRLFHITALGNLQNIFSKQRLLSNKQVAIASIGYTNIAHQGAQGSRSLRPVPTPPGGTLHDYVPFYFAPRSPMLYAINMGKVHGCELRQNSIVHLETTIDLVLDHGEPFVFFDRNATFAYSKPYTNLSSLDQVAWDLITEPPTYDGYCRYWQSTATNSRYADRMARRMAEFLIKDYVPLSAFTRIGVHNDIVADQVKNLLVQYGLSLPVIVMPEWYF